LHLTDGLASQVTEMYFGVRTVVDTGDSFKQPEDGVPTSDEEKHALQPREEAGSLRRRRPRPSAVVGFTDL
jgi:hypothetical protein